MDELLANADPDSQLFFSALTLFLFLSGFAAAGFLAIHHHRNPPDSQALTARIAARSWSTPQVGLVLGTFFLLYILATYLKTFFYEYQVPLFQVTAILLIYSIILILIALINRKLGSSWDSRFGMGARKMKVLLLAPLLYLALIPFLMLTASVYHLLLENVFGMESDLQESAQLIAQDRSWIQVLYMLAAIVAAPLYEEIIFRGMLFPYLVKRTGLVGGTILVSGIFALIHAHTPSFVPLLLLSAALCLAYWRTGSLWVSIGMHATFNAVSILALNIAG